MEKKNILVVSAVFPPEQVTSAALNYDLAKELSKSYNVTVLRPYPTRPVGMHFDDANFVDNSFVTVLVDSFTYPKSSLFGRFIESMDFGRKSVRYIKSHRKELNFVYNDGWQLFGLFLVAKVCVRYGIPYIVPIQDIYPECLLTKGSFPGLIKSCIKYLLLPFDKYYQKHAAKIRTISDEMADYLSSTRRINRACYVVINNWQNDEDFLTIMSAKPKPHMVFEYVGSINVHANVEMMIKAFNEASIPGSQFNIYGGGNRKDACQQLVKELDLINVTFGYVSRQEIPIVQASADVLLLALPKGNGELCLPSKLTSYMLSGKPIIASVDKDSATSRIIEGAHCGLIVEPDNQAALVDAFNRFALLSEKEREIMSCNSRNYAMKHLTKKVNLGIVVGEIKRLLG